MSYPGPEQWMAENDSNGEPPEPSAATDRAIANAMYALNPNQGEPVDASAALMWLRTTLPIEHPNFLTWQYVEATLGWSYV